jgi:predicted metalloprotease with PDZ domain
MIRHFFRVILFISILCNQPLLHAERLRYSLAVDQELYKSLKVKIDVRDITKKRLVFSMPIWIPGTYYNGTYGKNVINFSALGPKRDTLRVEKLSKSDWEVQIEGENALTVQYDVLVPEHGFMGKALDSTGALVQGASTWMYVRGMETLPSEIDIDAPRGWRIATGLQSLESPGRYSARTYDELADCPIMMGALIDTSFTCLGKPHEIYFRNDAEFDRKKFTEMVQKIVRYQTGLFGGAPYDRYVFQFTINLNERGGGGLEHSNSTSIGLSSLALMQDIKNAANVTAHEYFHLWNVKRLTSDQLLPLRYDREARMESLWWLEGVTSYYADRTMLRSGIWSVRDFLDNQEKEIEKLQENPDRLQTTLAQASWNVWEDGYASTGVSYYNKGQLVGLLLDLTIRKVSHNKLTLDDVMLYLYQNYALQSKGFSDDDIEKAVEHLTCKDFAPFFERYVTGLVELPFRELMSIAGLDAKIEKTPTPTIGPLRFLGSRNRIFSIDANSAAAKAGLRRDDQLISADDQRITNQENLEQILLNKNIGDTLKMVVLRNGANISFDLVIDSFEKVQCEIKLMQNPSEEQLLIRNDWLAGSGYGK